MVALIQWIPELTRDRMPDILHQALVAGTTIDVTYDSEGHVSNDISHVYLRDLSVTQAAELAQWSDMVVFDYITGNYDRIASMQVQLDTIDLIQFRYFSILVPVLTGG